ncbi:MAG: hypothetical protein GYB36_05535 [Alphaproteobacteria bacterium]|nr:hypothetical protein [Alphaproteobacteria bacterium]
MSIKYSPKLWGQVGAAALLTGLAACGQPAQETETLEMAEVQQPDISAPAPAGEGAGEGGGEGESGGGGEFGIDPAVAMEDPAVYLSALEVIRAHYLAGIDALLAGERAAGAEMFAHPISEIYVDLEEVVFALGAENFLDEMNDASVAPYDGRSDEAVRASVDAVLAAIDAAAEFAPAGELSSARVQAFVMAGMIDRAALQYQFAVAEPSASEAYLDGYGFERSAASIAARHMAAIRAEDAPLADTLEVALAALHAAYPQATSPETLDADVDQLLLLNDAVGGLLKPATED